MTAESDSSIKFLFSYTGREWDADAGLYYYRARWYDAKIGRFISEDPMGFAAGDANLSRYVGNNVSILRDPTGNQQQEPQIKEEYRKRAAKMGAALNDFLKSKEFQDHRAKVRDEAMMKKVTIGISERLEPASWVDTAVTNLRCNLDRRDSRVKLRWVSYSRGIVVVDR